MNLQCKEMVLCDSQGSVIKDDAASGLVSGALTQGILGHQLRSLPTLRLTCYEEAMPLGSLGF